MLANINTSLCIYKHMYIEGVVISLFMFMFSLKQVFFFIFKVFFINLGLYLRQIDAEAEGLGFHAYV